jgi:ubiquinone/menaquinone biosynthesis C-methylase UbiE
METQPLDPDEFRTGQRAQWNTAAAAWKKWSERLSGSTRTVSERLVELAEVRPGSQVLDIACGYGEPGLLAAERAAPDGKVTGTDIAPEMLAFGRERAAAAGIDNIEFIESAASGLDFSPGSFDAAVSRWGIIFEPEAEAVAARVRSFLRPGAKLAIASWGTPAEVPMLAIAMMTAMQKLGISPPPPGTPGPLSRPTPEAISGLLAAGGFSDIEVEKLDVVMDYESAEEYTTFIREIAPPVTALMQPFPSDVQEETWAAITEAARTMANEDGSLRLVNRALVAAGRA